MDAGEREVKKALEDVQVNNIKAIIAFTESSRQMVLAQQTKIDSLNSQIQAQADLLNQFRIQLAGIQGFIYKGGT